MSYPDIVICYDCPPYDCPPEEKGERVRCVLHPCKYCGVLCIWFDAGSYTVGESVVGSCCRCFGRSKASLCCLCLYRRVHEK